MNAALLKSERMDWNTPQVIVDALARFGEIALDPCSNPTSIIPAKRKLMLESGDDGLAVPWESLTYINPPYGRDTVKWVSKAWREWDKFSIEVLALVPARTDTRWFQDCCFVAPRICFFRGRLTFVGAPHPAPFPSAIVYWGDNYAGFDSTFNGLGEIVQP